MNFCKEDFSDRSKTTIERHRSVRSDKVIMIDGHKVHSITQYPNLRLSKCLAQLEAP